MQHQCKIRKMSSIQNILLRVSIVLGMVAAVVTIVYFSPMPDHNFLSCDRPCNDLDWPMICRIKLNLEMYQTTNHECEDCLKNSTNCDNQYCTVSNSANKVLKGMVIANRHLPGPPIHVCQNDVLVVDVVNKIPGHNVAVHWRGQTNHEAPFMDGAALITQCPITSYATFQYKFRVSQAGTHFYHAHSDADRTNGLFGALIVRQGDKYDPHQKLYDFDDKTHTLLISEWSETPHDTEVPKTLFINGKAQSVFNVKKGHRYRFRVAYASGSTGCPVTLTIDNHLMKVIAMDGNPTNPYEVSAVVVAKGERFDFVLKTNQEVDAYLLRIKSDCNNKLEGLALINYDAGPGLKTAKKEKTNSITNKVRLLDSAAVCVAGIGKVCLTDIKALQKMPQELKELEMDRKIYLTFDSVKTDNKENSSDLHKITNLPSHINRINNITFTYPPSPLLTQPADVPINILCNELNLPEQCSENALCECVHIEHIPILSTTELVLIHQGDAAEYIFHLHGYHFYVVGANTFDGFMSTENIKILDSQNKLMKRNFNSPPIKDTIRIPRHGVVAVRFIANNPGFWLLRDEKSKGWTRGMDIVFQVGDVTSMTSPPSYFPMCGNFIGPDFFLV